VQLAFELDVFNAFPVTFVLYLSYFVLALPAVILDRTGSEKGMAPLLWSWPPGHSRSASSARGAGIPARSADCS
jgi:hypothetical protein